MKQNQKLYKNIKNWPHNARMRLEEKKNPAACNKTREKQKHNFFSLSRFCYLAYRAFFSFQFFCTNFLKCAVINFTLGWARDTLWNTFAWDKINLIFSFGVLIDFCDCKCLFFCFYLKLCNKIVYRIICAWLLTYKKCTWTNSYIIALINTIY